MVIKRSLVATAVWRDFLAEQTHSNAREVIKLGEQTLEEQNQTGLSMLNPTHVKHRILIADQYLKDTPEETTANITKGWLRHPDGKLEYVGKFTKVKRKRYPIKNTVRTNF